MALNLEEEVVNQLKATQCLLTTVESCTGGLIANLITNISGASEIFVGATIAYDNAIKQELGVSEQAITNQGAVSPEVACALAEQGLKKIQNNPFLSHSYSLLKPKSLVCVSTTGIAGPSGGSKEKPVGLCYIGIAKKGQPTLVEAFQVPFPKDRIDTKLQFAHKALELLLKTLQT
jgi:nicotinamide mononucleotide (NMN) deamidase PncC